MGGLRSSPGSWILEVGAWLACGDSGTGHSACLASDRTAQRIMGSNLGRGTDGSDDQTPDAPALRSQHKRHLQMGCAQASRRP